MATVSDITNTPLSGLNHIDALLDKGPDWNYFTPAANGAANTLYFTFSVTSGNEAASSTQTLFSGTQQAFSAAQQSAVRELLKNGGYLNQVTGIHFVETSVGSDAQIHLSNANLISPNTTGLCSWHSSYQYSGTQLASYDADAWVYLDNAEWLGQNANLTPGGSGFQTLLHEMGHALGLKHPFDDGSEPNPIVLPAIQNSTYYTLMSYDPVGGPYTQYRQDDLAALKWLYGGDGLGGAYGINSTSGGRYLTGTFDADTLVGTTADDKLEGDGGNDMIDGGGGNDTAVFRGARSNYDISVLSNGDLRVASRDGIDGTDTLHNIGTLSFSDMNVARSSILAATSTPDAPKLAVTKNANGYTSFSTPLVTGSGAVGDTINVYTADNTLVGTTKVGADGLFSFNLNTFKDGSNYQIYATDTNAAGVSSAHTDLITFSVDSVAPVAPTATLSVNASGNVAAFTGSAEAGTVVQLVRLGATLQDAVVVAQATAGVDGKWSATTSPLPNGSYAILPVSIDKADNATSGLNRMNLTVNNPNNLVGTANNDQLTLKGANIAVDGGAGFDTLLVNGSRANYTVAKESWGTGLTDKVGSGGHDLLLNVERLQFSDGVVALDIDGNAGQAYRLYQAAFARQPDVGGLSFWVSFMDGGGSLKDVAKGFMTNQPEFDAKYGKAPSDADFITHLYANVLHRTPDAGGYAFWTNALHANPDGRAEVLIDFSESPENKALVIGSIQDGIQLPTHT